MMKYEMGKPKFRRTAQNKILRDLINCYRNGKDLPDLEPQRLFKAIFRQGDLIAIKNQFDAPTTTITLTSPENAGEFLKTHANALKCDGDWMFYRNPVKPWVETSLRASSGLAAHHGEGYGFYEDKLTINGEAVAALINIFFEFDEDEEGRSFQGVADKIRQIEYVLRSGLPITYIIDTGGKSLHIGISLRTPLSELEYRRIQGAILARLHGVPDELPVQPVQPERLPGTSRTLKDSSTGKVRLVALMEPIENDVIYDWIESTPLRNPGYQYIKAPIIAATTPEWAEAVMRYCEVEGIEIHSVREDKIKVYCPSCQGGRARDPKGAIFPSGIFSCVKCVDRFRITLTESSEKSPRDIELGNVFHEVSDLVEHMATGQDEDSLTSTHAAYRVSSEDEARKLTNLLLCYGWERLVVQKLFSGGYVVAQLFGGSELKDDFSIAINNVFLRHNLRGLDVNFQSIDPEAGTVHVLAAEHLSLGTTEILVRDLFDPRQEYWFFVHIDCGHRDDEDGNRNCDQSAEPQTTSMQWERMRELASEMTSSPWERLEQLRKINPQIDTDLEALTMAGFDIHEACAIFIKAAGGTCQNFPSSGKFQGVRRFLRSQTTSKNSLRCEVDGTNLASLLYRYKEKKEVALAAPPGWGKSTFIRGCVGQTIITDVASRETILISHERVEDALRSEYRINSLCGSSLPGKLKPYERAPDVAAVEKDGFRRLLQSPPVNWDVPYSGAAYIACIPTDTGIFEIGKRIPNLPLEHDEDDVTEDVYPPYADRAAAAIASYNQRYCSRPNPPKQPPPSHCRGCPHEACRIHPKHKLSSVQYPVVVATHKAFQVRSSNCTRHKPSELAPTVGRTQWHFDERPEVFFVATVSVDENETSLDELIEVLKGTQYDSELRVLEAAQAKMMEILKDSTRSSRINKKRNISWQAKKTCGIISPARLRQVRKAVNQAVKNQYLSYVANPDNEDNEYYRIKKQLDHLRVLTQKKAIFTLSVSEGKVRLKISCGFNRWNQFRNSHGISRIYDATAAIDPHYSLPGAFPILDVGHGAPYSNLTIHCTSEKEVSRRKLKARMRDEEIVSLVRSIAERDPAAKILVIVTSEDMQRFQDFFKDLEGRVFLNYHGNLKGNNQYRDCNHIVFGHVHRTDQTPYLALAEYLFPDFEWKTTWNPILQKDSTSIMEVRGGAYCFKDNRLESLRLQMDIVEIVQTIARTAIREDHEAKVDVWLPSMNAPLIGRLLKYFVGAKVAVAIKNPS